MAAVSRRIERQLDDRCLKGKEKNKGEREDRELDEKELGHAEVDAARS